MSTSVTPGYTSASSINGTESASSKKKRSTGAALDQAAFLKLLAAQLANQDPMEPTSDSEFIGTMAQFSSLEQMTEMNAAYTTNRAYSLIGKNVLGSVTMDDGTTKQVYGEVTGTVRQNKIDYLQVGNYLMPASSVTAVYDDSSMDGAVSGAANLIGKSIEATIPPDANSKTPKEVKGTVSSIVVNNGLLYAVVGDQKVQLGYITKITEAASSTGTGDSTATA